MILLLVHTASAAFPWDCPTYALPEDALPYRANTEALGEAYDALHAAAMAYWDDGCAWTETSSSTWESTYVEQRCDGADALVVYVEETWSDGTTFTETQTLTVEVPAGETWTRIHLTAYSDEAWWTSASYGSGSEITGEWSGSFGELPDDGWFSAGSAVSTFVTTYNDVYSDTPDCRYRWSQVDETAGSGSLTETVRTGSSDVEVVWDLLAYPRCSSGVYYGLVDGGMAGAVNRDTWALDPTDTDHDGAVGTDDCDPADPAVSCLADEVANDGIDQDCSGGDLVDWDQDGDGHDDVIFGGDDCDDTSRAVHPYADDPAGDGVDQDCDGADDVDADADGYTADRDDAPADCDDTNAAVNPGASERAYDGLDNDCDDGDLTDLDEDGEDSDRVGGPDCDDTDASIRSTAPEVECDGIDQDCDGADECPPPADTDEPEAEAEPEPEPAEEATGCAGAAAFVLALPLLYSRRRKR